MEGRNWRIEPTRPRVTSSMAGSECSNVIRNVFLQLPTPFRPVSTSPSSPAAPQAYIVPSEGPHGKDAPFFLFQQKVSGLRVIVCIGSRVYLCAQTGSQGKESEVNSTLLA